MLHLCRLNTRTLLTIGIFVPVCFNIIIISIALQFPNLFCLNDYDLTEMIKERPSLLFSVLIIAPLLETIIQYLPTKVACLFWPKNVIYG